METRVSTATHRGVPIASKGANEPKEGTKCASQSPLVVMVPGFIPSSTVP